MVFLSLTRAFWGCSSHFVKTLPSSHQHVTILLSLLAIVSGKQFSKTCLVNGVSKGVSKASSQSKRLSRFDVLRCCFDVCTKYEAQNTHQKTHMAHETA